MREAASIYVFDTSAWLSLIEDEAGADIVQGLLEKAKAGEVMVLVSFMSFMEVYYITLQERGLNGCGSTGGRGYAVCVEG